MSLHARLFIAAIAVLGAFCVGYGAATWHSADYLKFACYLAIALAASGMKVKLPGISGSMSVSFLFLLLGVVDLGLPEAISLAFLCTLIQCFWNRQRRFTPVQVLFNVSQTVVATTLASVVYHRTVAAAPRASVLLLALTAAVYFIANTAPTSLIIALTEGKSPASVWRECYFWSFPYFLLGASVAWLVSWTNQVLSWQVALLVLPVVYTIYRSYRTYLGKLETEKAQVEAQKTHVEQVAALHMRTIEALALAIEAKDRATHDHLERVRVYAVEIAKDLKLSPEEIEALKAASMLHDIGKLAVPEHIISKPGRLTPEEFEKMKIHPVVGSEILERVQFPYPVAPIVRAHHEKWNGSGYPDGLKGEAIPIGARILSAVDCLDALASDRQYRRALPLDKAMAQIASESGTSFDPRVIEILKARYVELEQMAHAAEEGKPKLSTDLKIDRGAAPAAGFVQEQKQREEGAAYSLDFLSCIAAARDEVQTLFELSHDLGKSLSLDETLSLAALRLKRLVHYDAIAIYLSKDDKLIAEFASGDNFRLFSSLVIPLGEGLSGWVAQNCKPILNGNPSVEPGYTADPTKFSTLRSAMAVPLEGLGGTVGVLALYRAEADAFSKDHLRILLSVSTKLGVAVENALRLRVAESSASTDYLTGLPNSRSLFVQLHSEVARCQRSGGPLAVLVCDLDGFKGINDHFGHLEGNRVLREFAARLQASCREYDFVARMGGDEFVFLLPGMNAEGLKDVIPRLEQIAAEVGIALVGDRSLSVSVGCAVMPEDGVDAEQLLTEADRRMYQVKRQHHEHPRVRTWFDFRSAGNASAVVN